MPTDAARHRRSIRLRDYDYSTTGMYFVTVCTLGCECLFGEVVDGGMRLNNFGKIVSEEGERSAEIRAELSIDAYVVMPNHFHGIVFIDVGAHGAVRPYDHRNHWDH